MSMTEIYLMPDATVVVQKIGVTLVANDVLPTSVPSSINRKLLFEKLVYFLIQLIVLFNSQKKMEEE